MGGIPLMLPWRLFHWLLRGMNALAYWDLMVCLTFMYIVWVRTVHKINFNPLGAGKATLISVLTGLYEPTSGIGRIAGYNISTDINKIHHHLGVCPQFDN